MATNAEILTHSHNVLKAKTRAKKNQIDSVVFDEAARRDFLTGFRKRNLVKKEAAKQKAKDRERQQRLETRKEQRLALRKRAEENVRDIERAYGRDVDAEDQDDCKISDDRSSNMKGKGKAIAEYENEEQLATVTIIDELDPDAVDEVHDRGTALGRTSVANPDSQKMLSRKSKDTIQTESSPLSNSTKGKSARSEKYGRERPKKIAYETKAARKASRKKQYTRMKEKTVMAMEKQRRKSKKRGK